MHTNIMNPGTAPNLEFTGFRSVDKFYFAGIK